MEEFSIPKPEFITPQIEIKGTPCSFQVASLKEKWAMRIIDNDEKKVLKVIKLKKVTSASITDNIRDVIGRKWGTKYKIDEMDLGAKMAKILRYIDTYEKTGKITEMDEIATAVPVEAKPVQAKPVAGKPARQPDSFWSSYSTAIAKPMSLTPKETATQPKPVATNTESVISFVQPTSNQATSTGMSTTPPGPKGLEDSLAILGVNCPVCGAEVDIDAEICPSCGTKID